MSNIFDIEIFASRHQKFEIILMGKFGSLRPSKRDGQWRMDRSTLQTWRSGLAINLVSNFIGISVGAIVTYTSHLGSEWTKPLLFGGAAWLITFCLILTYRIMKTLPPPIEPITLENVEKNIRSWLDKFNLTVRSVTDDEAYFFFIVTTDGGKKVFVIRNKKHFSDYITFRALITLTDQEKKLVDGFTDEEKQSAVLAIQLELSRAVIGYKTENMLEGFTIFKQIPITRSLNEREVIDAIWELEAVVSTILAINAATALRFRKHK